VAAHRAEAGVVHEQRAERGGRGGCNQESAKHLGASTGLSHEAAPAAIEPADSVVALFQDGGTVGFRKTFKDEAHRFAAGVHFDGAVGGTGRTESSIMTGWIARNEAPRSAVSLTMPPVWN